MKRFAALLAGFALSAATLHAQSNSSGVPESHRPPPGMCRIWIDGVPPAHQPAPTDCATAIRKRPLNARVVFGSEAPGTERNFAPQNQTPSRAEQERAAQQQQQRDAQQQQQQRDAQERQRAEAQRQREEQEKRAAASHAPPSPPPRTQERVAPAPRPHTEKPQRPPHSSFSTRRPG